MNKQVFFMIGKGAGAACPTPGTTIDTYSTTNQDDFSSIVNGQYEGQCLTIGADTCATTLQLYLRNTVSATGTIIGGIYATTGTVGSTALRTGTALATSASVDVSTIGATFALVTFTFSPAASLPAGDYWIGFDASLTSGSIDIGEDRSAPSHGGNVDRNGTAFAWDAPFNLIT